MLDTNQKVFAVFASGFFLLSTSILLINTDYFLYLFMIGLWLIILSGVLYKIYSTRTHTPKLSMPQKEQILSNMKLLLT